MAEKIIVKLETYSHIRVYASDSIAWEIREEFTFFVPGYKFMPKYRSGIWDGKIRIFDYGKRLLPAGLWHRLKKFAKARNYEIEIEDSTYGSPDDKIQVDPKKIMKFIDSLDLHSGGKQITIRDYQFDAICTAISERRCILLSPTGSGKSLIIYVLTRWYQENYEDKILIIVPTIQLVDQMYGDFEDYASNVDWNVKHELHKIYSGQEKVNVHENIYISTWQSIYKLPRTWFERFGCIFGDEAHEFAAQSLTKSMDKSSNAQFRIGTTGTLSDSKTNQLVLEGIFGKVFKVTTTKKLQENDTLSQLKIDILKLDYTDKTRQLVAGSKYAVEVDWIVRNEKRNKYICTVADSLEGNTLILFNFVDKHGKILFDMMKDHSKHRVFYVSGIVPKEDREAIRKIVETQKKSTTVASLKTFSRGINIKNLHNVLLVTPSKSKITVLQSIGRSLRKSTTGQQARLLDFADDLTYNGKKNYAMKHADERLKIYQAEQFDIQVHTVDIQI